MVVEKEWEICFRVPVTLELSDSELTVFTKDTAEKGLIRFKNVSFVSVMNGGKYYGKMFDGFLHHVKKIHIKQLRSGFKIVEAFLEGDGVWRV